MPPILLSASPTFTLANLSRRAAVIAALPCASFRCEEDPDKAHVPSPWFGNTCTRFVPATGHRYPMGKRYGAEVRGDKRGLHDLGHPALEKQTVVNFAGQELPECLSPTNRDAGLQRITS